MKRDLGENAVDRFLVSDEGYERDKDIFDRAVEDLKVMLGSKYPDFDFSEFHKEVAAAQAGRVKPASDPIEDLSLTFSAECISEEEPEDVSEDETFLDEPEKGGRSEAQQ